MKTKLTLATALLATAFATAAHAQQEPAVGKSQAMKEELVREIKLAGASVDLARDGYINPYAIAAKLGYVQSPMDDGDGGGGQSSQNAHIEDDSIKVRSYQAISLSNRTPVCPADVAEFIKKNWRAFGNEKMQQVSRRHCVTIAVVGNFDEGPFMVEALSPDRGQDSAGAAAVLPLPKEINRRDFDYTVKAEGDKIILSQPTIDAKYSVIIADAPVGPDLNGIRSMSYDMEVDGFKLGYNVDSKDGEIFYPPLIQEKTSTPITIGLIAQHIIDPETDGNNRVNLFAGALKHPEIAKPQFSNVVTSLKFEAYMAAAREMQTVDAERKLIYQNPRALGIKSRTELLQRRREWRKRFDAIYKKAGELEAELSKSFKNEADLAHLIHYLIVTSK